MLPVEIFTLVLLATRAYAIPRPEKPSAENTTASAIVTASSSELSKIPAWAHGESTQSGFESEPTQTSDASGDLFKCTETCGPLIIINQPTATGFETTNEFAAPSQSNGPRPNLVPTRNANVIVTSTPKVIGIHTNVAPTDGYSQPNNGPGNPAPNNEGTQTQGGHAPNAPAPTSESTSGGDLLTDIISHIAAPGPQPSQPASATGSGSDTPQSAPGNNDPQQMQQSTGQAAPGVTAGPDAGPTMALGGQITIGPATLTLTPGLSTTVGTGSAATYIAITTDGAGETIITISSSGTAVTATVTNAPATVTVPQTGFDASITDEARPGGHDSSSAGTAAASTSSKGGTVNIKSNGDWLMSIVLAIIGFGIAL